ncbi:hypothetical protein MBLNU230_g0219t1 [Neophaeotheca triangularis]
MSRLNCFRTLPLLPSVSLLVSVLAPSSYALEACGEALYQPLKYTCYDGDFLCPVLEGEPTLRCGPDCYLPSEYSCNEHNSLIHPASSGTQSSPAGSSSTTFSTASSTFTTVSSPASVVVSSSASFPLYPTPSIPTVPPCVETPTTLHLSDPPYENYFYSDCHDVNQVIITSPLPDSNLTLITPRLIFAWPSGNSGAAGFFAPRNGDKGTLGIRIVNGTDNQPVASAFTPQYGAADARYGVSVLVEFNASAELSATVLGSIRSIRDVTEGDPSLRDETEQPIGFRFDTLGETTANRAWYDNVTNTDMSIIPHGTEGFVNLVNAKIVLSAGTYNITATTNYPPQLRQLTAGEVLNEQSQHLIAQYPDETKALSFLSYSSKLLAGAWRFLTYFGRDSMISALLMQPILSEGEGGALEAVIGAVLERINRTDGSTAHEETIGDYATYLHLQNNVTSTAPIYDYKMIDSDFYLPVLMESYFLQTSTGGERLEDFLQQQATLNPDNAGLTYVDLAALSAERIMNITAAFAQPGGQTRDNLIRLKEGEIVGEWRDSTYGLGGGRIPYSVNTALVPAALRSIASLAAAGLYPSHSEWAQLAATRAQIWEDSTIAFFQVSVPEAEARALVAAYTADNSLNFPSNAEQIDSDVTYHAVALQGNNDQDVVRVMNTDDCFRLFFVNGSDDQGQLTAFLNQSATNLRRPFPAGLSTPVGLVVANPAYGGNAVYARNFTNADYHGTVVWSWQMAMMARGLERQLGRCSDAEAAPAFCRDDAVFANVLAAYNGLWDVIEANRANLGNEVWSWVYEDGDFQVRPLGAFGATESNIQQLWSLTFLAVTRDESLK